MNKYIRQIVMRYAFFIGLAMGILGCMIYASIDSADTIQVIGILSLGQIVGAIILLLGIIIVMRKISKDIDLPLPYWTYLFIGFNTAFYSALILGAIIFFWVKVINPDLIAQIITSSNEIIEKLLPELSGEEKGMTTQEIADMISPFNFAMGIVTNTWLYGFIVSIVASFFFAKKVKK